MMIVSQNAIEMSILLTAHEASRLRLRMITLSMFRRMPIVHITDESQPWYPLYVLENEIMFVFNSTSK